jgi:hypothetical protein
MEKFPLRELKNYLLIKAFKINLIKIKFPDANTGNPSYAAEIFFSFCCYLYNFAPKL